MGILISRSHTRLQGNVTIRHAIFRIFIPRTCRICTQFIGVITLIEKNVYLGLLPLHVFNIAIDVDRNRTITIHSRMVHVYIIDNSSTGLSIKSSRRAKTHKKNKGKTEVLHKRIYLIKLLGFH